MRTKPEHTGSRVNVKRAALKGERGHHDDLNGGYAGGHLHQEALPEESPPRFKKSLALNCLGLGGVEKDDPAPAPAWRGRLPALRGRGAVEAWQIRDESYGLFVAAQSSGVP